MSDIIDRLKEPEAHYPGNFDTPKRANAMLSCLCQEAMEEIESLRRELAEARQEIADRKADCETGHDQDEATITELRRQLVEKHVEVKRLKQSHLEEMSAVQIRLAENKDQLAVSQAREQQANECRIALVHQIHELADHIERAEYCINDIDMLKQMRGQRAYAMNVASQWNQNGNPFVNDTAALSAMIAKAGEVMRERCAVECETHYNFSNALAAAIRALPGVVLDDIK